MKAFVITLKDNEYSENAATRCIISASNHGLSVEKFYGIDRSIARQKMQEFGLSWTWAEMNTKESVCPKTGLVMMPYRAASLDPIIGCAMSHYSLWQHCVDLNEPIVILEHDSVFIRDFPNVDFKGICGLNDPRGATRKAHVWYKKSAQRGGNGVFPKPSVIGEKDKNVPDGLAGNSAYMIKPWAAKEVINKVKEIGVWPNDATICVQLFPYLEECYPYVTKVQQGKSTTTK